MFSIRSTSQLLLLITGLLVTGTSIENLSRNVTTDISEDFWSKLVKVLKEGGPVVNAAVKEFGPELEGEITNATKAYINLTVTIRIDGLEKEISSSRKDMEGLKSGVTNVQSQITGLRVDVTDIKSDVREASSKLSKLETQLSNFQNTTKEWDEKLNGTVSDIDIKTGYLMLGLAGVKTDISAVKTELKTDISALKTELKTDISAVKTELKTDISAVKTELKTDISAVKTDISALKTELKTDISDLKGNLKVQFADVATHITNIQKSLDYILKWIQDHPNRSIPNQITEGKVQMSNAIRQAKVNNN